MSFALGMIKENCMQTIFLLLRMYIQIAVMMLPVFLGLFVYIRKTVNPHILIVAAVCSIAWLPSMGLIFINTIHKSH